jgi:fimbrial chaperone protein
MRAIAVSLLAIGMLAAALPAAASSISVAPIRVELSGAKRTAVLTVRNSDDSPVVVQARPVAWTQRDGEDQLDDTHDLVVTPPIFTIPGKGQQVLRIALLRDADATRELDSRMVLSEVPSSVTPETTGLRVALRITLPVFIAAQAHTGAEVAWSHKWQSDGTLEITAQNRGTAHLQILDFAVQGAKAAGQVAPHYLLPGTIVHWELHPDGVAHDAPLVLKGHSDAGDFTVTSAPGSP